MDKFSSPATFSLFPISLSRTASLQLALLFLLGIWLFGLEGGWLFGLDLGGLGLTDRDEGSNAEAAREMLETGNWISPTLNYEPRYAKPAFVYWLISGAYTLWGINEFAARFPSAVSGLCLLLVQYAFVYRWCGTSAAGLSSLMLLLNMEFLGINRMVLTDPELVVFTTLAGYSFWQGLHHEHHRRWWLAVFYLAMGFGMLVKGPVGLIIPLVGVIPYLIFTRQGKRYWQQGFPIAGLLLTAVIAAPWYIMMFQIHGEAYWAAAQANTTGRFMNPMEGHGGTIFFYLPVFLIGFFPWSTFLPAVIIHSWKQWKIYWQRGQNLVSQEQHLEFFLSLWVVGLLLFFTLSATRLPHYIYPAFPASAVLVGLWWNRMLNGESAEGMTLSIRMLMGTGYVFGFALLFLPAMYHLFINDIAKEFPAAVHMDWGWLPYIGGGIILLGTLLMRQLLLSDSKRQWAFWTGGGIIVTFAYLVVQFGLPKYQQYFIGPPQELAEIAQYNLGREDRLIQVGRKRPSLSFYAKRKVYFLRPQDEEWPQIFSAPGRKMVILQTPLRRDLPEPLSDWTVVLEHGGFVLLSSDSLMSRTAKEEPKPRIKVLDAFTAEGHA